MTRTFHIASALAALLLAAAPLSAQQEPAEPAAAEEAAAPQEESKGRPITLQYFRPQDQRGINVFETTKDPGVEYKGFKLDWGAAFASQFQSLSHENTALPSLVNGADVNQLATIGAGFNNSTANLYLHAQLAQGIRVSLSTYLSSRHHPETWVKDGYIQIDASPIEFVPLQALMQYMTVRVGHFEINYGDAHFRRSDNGNAIYNPFVGNYILDAFTTEIGGEVYLKTKGLIAMGAVTGGEIRGTVLQPNQRTPSYIGKLGFDRQVNKELRVRLTGSTYRTKGSMSNTLYAGDRAGSRYYYVMENTAATEAAQATSGLLNPGFRRSVTAYQVNPFVKFRGLELFGVLEQAKGRGTGELVDRTFNQYAVDAVYRLLPREQLFVGVRYNKAEGELTGIAGDVGATRWQVGGGWFITPGLLAKLEYVKQTYTGFPAGNIRNGGRFDGLMLEGVVAF